jgi:molybdopterin converting factor subunit 1
MTIRLRFFASLRERLGRGDAEVSLGDGACVADAWEYLCHQHPQIQSLGTSMSFALNREYVDRDHALAAGDELALIPPVSGGL